MACTVCDGEQVKGEPVAQACGTAACSTSDSRKWRRVCRMYCEVSCLNSLGQATTFRCVDVDIHLNLCCLDSFHCSIFGVEIPYPNLATGETGAVRSWDYLPSAHCCQFVQ